MYCIVDRYTKKNAFVTSVKKRVQMHLGKLQEERMESIVHWFAANMPSFLSPEVAVSGTSRRTALSNTFKDSDDAGDCNLYNWKFNSDTVYSAFHQTDF